MLGVSGCHLMIGLTNSFWLLCGMQGLHSALASATQPLTQSLFSSYFSGNQFGAANSGLMHGSSIAIALSNLSILLIDSFGWRSVYGLMASVGIAAGMAVLLLLKNPKRVKRRLNKRQIRNIVNTEKRNFSENIKEMISNKTCRNVLWGGIFQQIGATVLTYFLPVYFQRVYPQFKAQYAVLGAPFLLLLG